MLERLIIVGSPPSGSDAPPTARDPVIAPRERQALAREFPDLEIAIGPIEPSAGEPGVTVDGGAWQQPTFDCRAVDAQMSALTAQGAFSLQLMGPHNGVAGVALQLLTRYQRFIGRRNHASQSPVFDQVLSLHRQLHDLERPLVRADHEHALDTWQWMLRLDPAASFAAQVAALFHDIERLASEADVRIEHRAPNYLAFKEAHARAGAAMTRAALASAGIEGEAMDRIEYLIQRHERPQRDPELAVLCDADALSFFSLNSAGFLDYFGFEHTRRKVAYTFSRLRPEARGRLLQIRYRPEVEAMVMAELAEAEARPSAAALPG